MLRIVNYDKLISQFAEEIAYHQNDADWWYYIMQDQEMSSWILDTLLGIKDVANRLGILEESWDLALNLYDFSNSGKSGFQPDLNHIQRMHDYFEGNRRTQLIF